MVNPFHNATTAGLKAIQSMAGDSITYLRGATEATVTAVKAGKPFVGESADGSVVVKRPRDFIIKASDLSDVGLFPPEAGDEISDADSSGTVFVYRVTPTESEDAWKWSDNNYSFVRVSTILERVQ